MKQSSSFTTSNEKMQTTITCNHPAGSTSTAPIKVQSLKQELSRQVSHSSDEDPALLIDWHVGVLRDLIKKIYARRTLSYLFANSSSDVEEGLASPQALVVEEIVEVIPLPETSETPEFPVDYILPGAIEEQLQDLVSKIADMYRSNPFHNFQHASRVTKSLQTFLSKIVPNSDKDAQSRLTTDPVTQFALLFSALIHDVDHMGVPNNCLVEEKSTLAAIYENKSVAEQNSVNLAWNLLLQPQYTDLRNVLYTNQEEFQQFRQIIVNAVMATDIMDKELKILRNERWNKAFAHTEENSGHLGIEEDNAQDVNRRATSILEHLIQAADVAHTMDNFDAYREWNACLFAEMSRAYEDGRAKANPADNWYKGEIGFLDFYIIPLAKTLSDSGIFGSSGNQFLLNAQNNRREWDKKGRLIVADLVTNRLQKQLRKNVSRPAAA